MYNERCVYRSGEVVLMIRNRLIQEEFSLRVRLVRGLEPYGLVASA